MVVTKKNGENPCVRTSVFFLSFSPSLFFFVLPAAFQFQAAGVKEEGDEGKGVGVGGCLPFWCSGFFPSQPGGPVWSFAVRGVKSVFGRE